MVPLVGYSNIQSVYEGPKSVVYQGRREVDDLPVIIKVLKNLDPTQRERARYRQEFEILRLLNGTGAVQAYDLVELDSGPAFVMEDLGGLSLQAFQQEFGPLNFVEFLHLALALTKAVEAVHDAHIIHKDIHPGNIVLAVRSNSPVPTGSRRHLQIVNLKLIDFGLATRLSWETPAARHPDALEGHLAYISPEQTGRMNRHLDSRTDLYSLGVTLYESLTGRLPFPAEDAVELVHSHLARRPMPPHELLSDQLTAKAGAADQFAEPLAIVSAIIIKLLAKNAEDRYQSARGLQHDLQSVLALCTNDVPDQRSVGGIVPFELGTRDVVARLQIPQRLYGREQEVDRLLLTFEGMAETGQAALLLVAGGAGVGKSSLVHELYKPLTLRAGHFVTGKFDQLQRNVPYSALTQAFNALCRQLLTEPTAILNDWRQRILTAVGHNAQVIIDIVPDLRLIIGDQPAVAEVGPQEAEHRFRFTFQHFITAICRADEPLVLFLDDMQWADLASLSLLKSILRPGDTRHLLLIGAFRDNDVTSAHPLTLAVEEIQRQSTPVSTITLNNLTQIDVSQLVQDALHCSSEAAVSLGGLVHQKTLGNAFFVHQFLQTLVDRALLRFEPERGGWIWDIGQIQASNITDNVVELLARKLIGLPAATAEALQLAACIGDHFDLATLALVSQCEQPVVANALWTAQVEGFVVALDEQFRGHAAGQADGQTTPSFRFVHDRIQQAAYSVMNEARRSAAHLQIGRLLLARDGADQLGSQLFEVVDQLNGGRSLLQSEAERRDLAQLNLLAGRKARASAAYAPAMNYFRMGLSLLPPDSWHVEYTLTLALHTEAAAAAYLSGDVAATFELAAVARDAASSVLDQVQIYEVLIQAVNAQRELAKAVETAREILGLLGITFPDKPTPEDLGHGFATTAALLAEQPLDQILDLPSMTVPEMRAIMRIINGVTDAAYHVAPDLLPLMVCRQIQLSLEGGLAPEASVAFALYGLMLCGVVGDIETGTRFGQLALGVLERFKAEEHRAMTLLAVYNNIMPWKVHPRQCLPHLLDAYQSGVETGDLTFATVAAHAYCYHAYFVGKPLQELAQEMAAYEQAIAKLGQLTFLNYHHMYYQAVLNLLSEGAAPTWLQGPVYDHVEMQPLNVERQDITALFVVHFNHCVLAYLFDDYRQAAEQAEQAEQYLAGVVALIHAPILCFYDSLARLALASDAPETERIKLLEKAAANQVQLKRWAAHAPDNHQHKYDLVAAEQARVAGEHWQATQLYEQAAAGARRHLYLQEEAVAYEAAARFYLANGLHRVARTYLLEASDRYRAWQATAKVRQLAQRYPQWPELGVEDRPSPALLTSVPLRTTTRLGASLDLASIMKALHVIAGEIELERLLARVMTVILENAGAEQGILLLPAAQFQQHEDASMPAPISPHAGAKAAHTNGVGMLEPEGSWLIQAAAAIGQPAVQVLQSLPAQTSAAVPLAVLNYVAHTRSTVILDDAATSGAYLRDVYVRQRQPHSVACVPLLNQGRLIGIVYLENNLVTGAFTQERLEVLQLLSAQLAISLDNALLYRDVQRHRDQLEVLVAERTVRLEAALVEADRLFEEAQRAKAVAEAASRAKSDFLATMSHELRTPLNAVLGFSQLLQRDASLTATQAEHVRLINRSGEHLLKLINDVLDLSKIEAGHMGAQYSDLDLHGLLDDMAHMFRLGAVEKGLDFTIDSAPDVPRLLRTDERKLRQILINLLGNAVKFTREGSVTLRVAVHPDAARPDQQVSAESAANMRLRFEISDTGPGIASGELATLFDPFVQAEAGQQAHTGTGLGLALSRRFASLLGGDLRVTSQVGRGTTFMVDVMVQTAAAEPELPLPPVSRVIGLVSGQPAYRLLIVDDAPQDRLLLRRLLEPLGFLVAEAENGAVALDLWRNWRPDLIWMDSRMPVLDGAGATRQMRAQSNGHATIIIAVTASSIGEERERMLEAGCDDVLFKPFRAETIFSALQRYLGVQFVGDTLGSDSTGIAGEPARIRPDQLRHRVAVLPAQWLAALRTATIGCDLNRIHELIDQLEQQDSELAETLAAWADDFEYDQILAALAGA